MPRMKTLLRIKNEPQIKIPMGSVHIYSVPASNFGLWNPVPYSMGNPSDLASSCVNRGSNQGAHYMDSQGRGSED